MNIDDEINININLLEYLRVILRRKWLIVGIALLFAVSAFSQSIKQPKLYKASATLMFMDSSMGSLAMVSSLFGGAGPRGSVEDKVISILQSKNLARQVFDNMDRQAYFPELFNNNHVIEKDQLENYVSRVRGAISVKQGNLFCVSAVWTDPQKAADLVNFYIDQLGKFINFKSMGINFMVVDPAEKPLVKCSPHVIRSVMVATIFGLFLGILLALVLEYIWEIKKFLFSK
ncbi:MAG: Wzz/FepE/Etk N-terminal domain-containing protein [Candidatus Margulisiibacteriota bacterium]